MMRKPNLRAHGPTGTQSAWLAFTHYVHLSVNVISAGSFICCAAADQLYSFLCFLCILIGVPGFTIWSYNMRPTNSFFILALASFAVSHGFSAAVLNDRSPAELGGTEISAATASAAAAGTSSLPTVPSSSGPTFKFCVLTDVYPSYTLLRLFC